MSKQHARVVEDILWAAVGAYAAYRWQHSAWAGLAFFSAVSAFPRGSTLEDVLAEKLKPE